MLRSLLTALVAVVLLAGGASAQPQDNIAYGSDPAQVLDLYAGAGPGPHRLVVFLHGGGWVAGQKGVGRIVARPLNAAGYTVASVGYRLLPHTNMAGAMQDAAAATAFLLNHAAQFGIDPSHFAVMGHSSGAHMAALLGTDQSYLHNAGVDVRKLAAVVTLDGVYDVGANVTHFPTEQRREVFTTDPATWQHFSPIDRLKEMTAHPRFCVVHEDTNARFVEQAGLFAPALQKQGEKLETLTAPGLTHGQLVRTFDQSAEPMAGFTLGCLAKAF